MAACGGGDNQDTNKDVITKIVASIVDCDGVSTLINASEEYTGGSDYLELAALELVWGALQSIIIQELEIQKEQAIAVFETSIDVMSYLKSVDAKQSSGVLDNIFITRDRLVRQNYLTTEYCIQNETCVCKYLDVFKKHDGTWIDRGETVTQRATRLFTRCHTKKLLVNGDADFEILLPFFAFALKQHAENQCVQRNCIQFLDASCSVVRDKNIIKRLGVMKSLAAILLTSNARIDDDFKKIVGVLIGKIAALV